VALVVGAEPGALMTLAWRDLVATIVGTLTSRPLVLAAFLASLGIVLAGGSLFVFLIKGGTIATLVRGEQEAGPVEEPPLQLMTVAQASVFSMEEFVARAGALFPRYARLGGILMAAYVASGAIYVASIFAGRAAEESWALTALLTASFVAWITIVNFAYLLMQIVIAADDCSVAHAWTRVAAFVRRERATVLAVFLVVLAIVVFACWRRQRLA
jgi:hypothetical protein